MKLLQGDDIKVKVYYNDLSDIQASQGSEITSDDVLKANLLKITANEGSKIQMKVDVKQLNVRGNSGGEVELSGNADVQEIVMNSGAKYKGDDNEGEKCLRNCKRRRKGRSLRFQSCKCHRESRRKNRNPQETRNKEM